MSTSVLKALPGKLDVKRHSSGILYLNSHWPCCLFYDDDSVVVDSLLSLRFS